jgi:hypothetical protein
MAVIQFVPADALQTTVVEAAIYPSEVSKIDGPKASASGKSSSYFVDITIIDGKYKGKTRTITFNDGTKSPSLLGEAQFYPVAYMLQLDSAISGRKVVPENYYLDTDSLLHKPFDAAWGVATEDGHLFNTINAFHPKGYGASAPAF